VYGVSTTSATSAGAAGATTLAQTGASTFWFAVTGIALLMLGLMIKRLVPKDEF
jgi:LPXTG-motif cell wall-anchored protein